MHTPGLSKQQVSETGEVLWQEVGPLVEQPEEMLALLSRRLVLPTGDCRAIAAATETKTPKTMALRMSCISKTGGQF